MERLPTPPSSPEAYSATATVDERGLVTAWSEGAGRLLGYRPSEVVGRRAALLLADAHTTDDGRAWREAAGRRRWHGTVPLRHRDGHRLVRDVLAHRRDADGAGSTEWLLVSAVAAPSPSGGDRPLGEWAFARSPCVLAVFDQDLRLARASTGMERVLALPEATVRGLRLSDIVPLPDCREAEAAMRSVLDGGPPQEVEVGLDTVRPRDLWRARLIPLDDPDGQVGAVCLVAHARPPEDLVRRRMRLLSDAGRNIGTSLDTGRTAQELADVAVPRLADTCTVDLLDPPRHGRPPPSWSTVGLTLSRAGARSVSDRHRLHQSPERARRCAAASPSARCLTLGQGAVHSGDEDTVARWAREDPQAAWIRDSGTHSLMVVPIRADGTSYGVAVFGRHQSPRPFDADDLWLAEQLTAKAATSIHSTRRPQRDHTTTMALQRSLLPQTLPEQGALDIATRYLPSVSQAGVGGDWFDVVPLSGSRVALVVGDVVGHGIRASATMGRVRTAVRTLADVDLPPDELLSHLDDLVIHLCAEETGGDVAGESAAGVGTTCLYAVYDPVSRHCTVARAGHPPPAVVTPGGTVHFLDVPPGPPLGLGGLPFEAYDIELPEGSLIALYTNGLLEARDHDIDDALDNMFAALAGPAQSLDGVCDRVLTAMLTHRPDDDIALLIARTQVLKADQVATWELPFEPATVGHARQQAIDQLTAWRLDEAVFITELVVSELVTNAIRYGRPPVRLRLIHDNHTLTCEVFDSSNTAPHMRRARVFDEGGRGLLLVGQLCQRWGTRHTVAGKTVWAEMFVAQ
ncbi:SpoIIE family protein phosphatase [Streptomyces sp. NPDC086787]|uniref:SpoIIE family protein phosphatase n=1 Tax=Streptomyces sp. NPDC086787 TaxID=3365759 RepID=UPI003828AF46